MLEIIRGGWLLEDVTDLIDLVACEGSVGGHEEVAPWGWDERGDDADKVVIHISGVS